MKSAWMLIATVLVLGVPAKSSIGADAPFKKTFDAIRNGQSAREVWAALTSSSVAFGTEDSSQTFQFEYVAIASPRGERASQARLVRTLVDCHQGHATLLVLGNQNLPVGGYCRDHQFAVLDETVRYQAPQKWGFVVDGRHTVDFFDSTSVRGGSDYFVQFDAASFLSALTKPDDRCSWDMRSRTLRNENAKRVIEVRFRLPADSVRYGTALSEIRIVGKNSTESFRSFTLAADGTTRLNRPDCEELRRTINAKLMQEVPRNWATIALTSSASRKLGRQLWQEFQDAPVSDKMAIDVRRDVSKTILFGQKEIYGPEANPDQVALGIFAKLVTKQLQAMYALACNKTAPQDGTMVWREIEARIGPYTNGLLYAKFATPLLNSEKLPQELKIELCDAIGDCGPPPFLGKGNAFDRTNVFFDAILRSRWGWTCGDKHFNACVQALSNSEPGSHQERVAVETLVRMGRANAVPNAQRQRWWQSLVDSNSDAIRTQGFTILAACREGRIFLLKELAKEKRASIHREIMNVLRREAECTLEAKRFEYMTAEECRTILAACSSGAIEE